MAVLFRLEGLIPTSKERAFKASGHFEPSRLGCKTITEVATVNHLCHLLTPSFISSLWNPLSGSQRNRAQSLPLAIVSYENLIPIPHETTGTEGLGESGIGSKNQRRVDEENQMIDEKSGEDEMDQQQNSLPL